MNKKHTPGPWSFQRGTVDFHIYPGFGRALSWHARGMNDRNWDFSQEDFANAQLMAASPDLLDVALEDKEALADAHEELCKANPMGHGAIASCSCSVAMAYRHTKIAIKKAMS